MKTIKVTIKPATMWGSSKDNKELTVRECKTGYPFLRDWRVLKAALAEFRRCRMEDGDLEFRDRDEIEARARERAIREQKELYEAQEQAKEL